MIMNTLIHSWILDLPLVPALIPTPASFYLYQGFQVPSRSHPWPDILTGTFLSVGFCFQCCWLCNLNVLFYHSLHHQWIQSCLSLLPVYLYFLPWFLSFSVTHFFVLWGQSWSKYPSSNIAFSSQLISMAHKNEIILCL